MAGAAYYNEIDPYAADWLRNLIAAGHIAPGDVDERSIEDVHPDDLRPYTQCHFFAGIGVWSYALRRAGWPDDRPVWTGSCPCQPFSAAGKGTAFDDERHLWPAWHWLIQECRPPVVFGEQVASKDADPWIDLVQDDLEAVDYAIGAVPFPAAGIGSPHIRDRLYWVADAAGAGSQGGRPAWGTRSRREGSAVERGGATGRLEHACGIGRERREGIPVRGDHDGEDAGRIEGDHGPIGVGEVGDGPQPAGPVNGFWRAADWLLCRDGRWRPVEPGTQPLVNGAPARVGRLRAYGNAINAVQAQIFIESVLDIENGYDLV
ncbi:DNA cytosine methyltransferase [Achromobacter xylosoxidans]|uniref:Methyltransferase n=1 Tax=Alcaligenes xylosoxydans xylosoxydans TaxID=85698 RepID=A0A1R1JMG4_ALCXX|nr:DNA cytosine methyltransferase [Achromobacter xylosoxidans]OMG78313.1 methyltransferase [Achromobacter xylosoxidans]